MKQLRYWEEKAIKLRQGFNWKKLLYIIFATPIYILIVISIIFVFVKIFEQGNKNSIIETSRNYCDNYPGDKTECLEMNRPSNGQTDSYPNW